ncbi:MAG: FHA domain-containing protein [Anaerolineae bacterium]
MRIRRVLSTFICLASLLSAMPTAAQEGVPEPPVVDILGTPDTRSQPPNAHLYVSVVDRLTGRAFLDLEPANFAAQVSEVDVETAVEIDTTGLAVVMVIDRGGIAQRGDPRIGRSVDLASALLEMLTVDGTATADMVALIGIRGEEQGGLTPVINFTDYDPNVISNAFDGLRTEVVNETTPLYDGLDRAIAWITDNPDPQIREKLVHRRRIILVFSDGIDRDFSDESHETLIVNQAAENDILIYAVQMSDRGRTGDSISLSAMATQTQGALFVHSPESHEEVLARLQDITTQREAYRLTFPLIRPQGLYQVEIQVLDTPGGSASDAESITSHLERPGIAWVAPPELQIVVPYSETALGFLPTSIPLSVQMSFKDGASREPEQVSYFANEQRIGLTSAGPDYAFEWDVADLETPATEPVTRTFTLIARATDPYLEEPIATEPLDIQITWEQKEETLKTVTEDVASSVALNWWVLPLFGVLAVGIVVLAVLLIRTRGQVAKQVVKGTTAVVRGVTQRLGAGGGLPAARGKLVVTRGPRTGTEFRLATSLVRVGRDPEYSDFALHDQYVSNPHFSVIEEGGQFYIRDEESTNQTRLNGAVVPANQRIVLPPDAVIDAGQTRLQFRRLGGETRLISARAQKTERGSSGQDEANAPTQRAGPGFRP